MHLLPATVFGSPFTPQSDLAGSNQFQTTDSQLDSLSGPFGATPLSGSAPSASIDLSGSTNASRSFVSPPIVSPISVDPQLRSAFSVSSVSPVSNDSTAFLHSASVIPSNGEAGSQSSLDHRIAGVQQQHTPVLNGVNGVKPEQKLHRTPEQLPQVAPSQLERLGLTRYPLAVQSAVDDEIVRSRVSRETRSNGRRSATAASSHLPQRSLQSDSTVAQWPAGIAAPAMNDVGDGNHLSAMTDNGNHGEAASQYRSDRQREAVQQLQQLQQQQQQQMQEQQQLAQLLRVPLQERMLEQQPQLQTPVRNGVTPNGRPSAAAVSINVHSASSKFDSPVQLPADTAAQSMSDEDVVNVSSPSASSSATAVSSAVGEDPSGFEALMEILLLKGPAYAGKVLADRVERCIRHRRRMWPDAQQARTGGLAGGPVMMGGVV
jgi:hypothetical protein